MEISSFINKIDRQLRVMSEVHNGCEDGQYHLHLTLFYNNDNMGKLDYKFTGYHEEDLIRIAKNIKANEFLMREIDDFLCGEIE